MSPEKEIRPSSAFLKLISDLPSGRVIPWKVVYQGKQFPGEILALENWDENLGSTINQGSYFRIIVFTQPQDIPPQCINDPRIVFSLPGKLTYRLKEQIREYRALHENKARYLDQKQAPTQASQELQLAHSLAKEETELYRSGQIITCQPLALSPTQVFSLSSNKERFDFIAHTICQYWDKLFPILPEVLAVKSYLNNIKLRESDSELAMDKISILEQLAYDNLLSNPRLWSSLKALFDWFQSRYRPLYLAYHAQFQKELSSFHSRLKKTKPRLEALQQLNSIAELGEPLGSELFSEWEALLLLTKPCPVGEKASVEAEPVCPGCGLSLTAQMPLSQIENFFERLEQALREQLHRLSSETIRQILSQSREERIDQFIKVVQASDLSALVNVLDDELVKFIRLLLAEGQYAR